MNTMGEGPPGHSIRQACRGIIKCVLQPLPPAMGECQIYELACQCSPIGLHNCRAVAMEMTHHWWNLMQGQSRICIWPSSSAIFKYCYDILRSQIDHRTVMSPLRNWTGSERATSTCTHKGFVMTWLSSNWARMQDVLMIMIWPYELLKADGRERVKLMGPVISWVFPGPCQGCKMGGWIPNKCLLWPMDVNDTLIHLQHKCPGPV